MPFTRNASVTSVRFADDVEGTLTVTELDQRSSLPGGVPGELLKTVYLTGSPTVENATATMRMRVSTARLRSAGVNASNVQVAHYDNGSWHLLDTTDVNRTNETVTIETVTHGFSPFAVTAVGTPSGELAVTPEMTRPGETLTPNVTDSRHRSGDRQLRVGSCRTGTEISQLRQHPR